MNETDEISVAPPRPDKVLTIAVGLVALFGALELAAVGLHFAMRARTARALTEPSVNTTAAAPVATASPATAPSPTDVPATSPPASVVAAPPSAAALSAADRLLKEATMLRDHGDTGSALTRLQEAGKMLHTIGFRRRVRNPMVCSIFPACVRSVVVCATQDDGSVLRSCSRIQRSAIAAGLFGCKEKTPDDIVRRASRTSSGASRLLQHGCQRTQNRDRQ